MQDWEDRLIPSHQQTLVWKVDFSLQLVREEQVTLSPTTGREAGAEEVSWPFKEGSHLAWPASGAHRRGKGGRRCQVRSALRNEPASSQASPRPPSRHTLAHSTGGKTEASRWTEILASGLAPTTMAKVPRTDWSVGAGAATLPVGSGAGPVQKGRSFLPPVVSFPLCPSL